MSIIWHVNVQRAAARQLEAVLPDRRRRILSDIHELAEDPFRGLVKPLMYKGVHRKISGRYRIIFEPFHGTRTVDALAVLLRNERTYQ